MKMSMLLIVNNFSPERFVSDTELVRRDAARTCLISTNTSKQSRYDCQSDSPPIKLPRLP